MTRLIYETSGGDLSPSITFSQLLEYIRLAEEDARLLYRATNDLRWKAFAENLSRCHDLVNHLATNRSTSSVGYAGHA